MTGKIYYYYDRVLVAGCIQRNLYSYAGKVSRQAVVQLAVHPLELKTFPPTAGACISMVEDYYQAVLPGNIVYKIHKDGKLIRAYTPELSQIEKTIMDIPMAILAMLQGKLLLHASSVIIKGAAYVVIGAAEMGKALGLRADSNVLVSGSQDSFAVTEASFPGFDASRTLEHPQSPVLGGICVLCHGGKKAKAISIISPEIKKKLLLKNFVGIGLFSRELRQQITDSRIIEEISRNIPIKLITMPEGFEMQKRSGKRILKLIRG